MTREFQTGRSWRGTQYLGLVAVIAVTCVAFGFALRSIDLGQVWHVASGISARTVLIVGGLLLFGALVATIRFWFMASDLGHDLSARDAMLALSLGQIVGALTVQYFGQIAARSALLGPRGLSAPANIVLATYERFIAAAVSGALAIAGAWYLFGRVALNFQSGGDQFIKILFGIACAAVAGALFGWGTTVIDAAQRQSRARIVVSISRSVLLTLVIQACTIAAYVVGARSLAPHIPLSELIAAAMVVTFVASLPISFAGWGVRELSAVLALGAIGVQNETALTVAIFIGTLAMVMVIGIAMVATVLPHGTATIDSSPAARSGYAEIASAVQLGIPLLAATAVFFQLFVPVGTTLVNVNLADPIAILGGFLFLLHIYSRGTPQWRLGRLNAHVAVATAVIAAAFLHGYYLLGWNDWAFTNKLLGWLILLCYGATGAMIVGESRDGIVLLVRTFIAVAVGITLFEMLLVLALLAGLPLPRDFVLVPLQGFSQNRNAFAFLLILAVCGCTLVNGRSQGWVLGVLLTGIWFAGSRAGFGAIAVVLGVACFLRAISLRSLAIGLAVPVATLGVVMALPWIVAHLPGGNNPVPWSEGGGVFNVIVFQQGPLTTDTERLKSIMGGLELFLSHPLFGGGLGAYAAGQIVQGQFLVIHSTPVWLLAEMGLIGLLAFAGPAVRIFHREWAAGRQDPVGRMLILMLLAFGVMSLVHEMMYQRAFWLLLGAGLACVPVRDRLSA